MRKRLRAIQAVLRGASHQQAACVAKSELSTIDSWIHLAQTGGLKALLSDLHGVPGQLDTDMVASRRPEIAAALKTELTSRQISRLRALDAFLSGESRDAAAHIAGIQRDALNSWIRIFLSHGIAGVIRKAKPRSCVYRARKKLWGPTPPPRQKSLTPD
jgi:hypothetical protein